MSPLTALLKFIQTTHIENKHFIIIIILSRQNFYKLAINSESRRRNRLLMSEEYSSLEFVTLVNLVR